MKKLFGGFFVFLALLCLWQSVRNDYVDVRNDYGDKRESSSVVSTETSERGVMEVSLDTLKKEGRKGAKVKAGGSSVLYITSPDSDSASESTGPTGPTPSAPAMADNNRSISNFIKGDDLEVHNNLTNVQNVFEDGSLNFLLPGNSAPSKIRLWMQKVTHVIKTKTWGSR